MLLLVTGMMATLLAVLLAAVTRQGRRRAGWWVWLLLALIVSSWMIASAGSSLLVEAHTRAVTDRARDATKAEILTAWEQLRTQLPADQVIAAAVVWDCATLPQGVRHIMDTPTGWIRTCSWQITIISDQTLMPEEQAENLWPQTVFWIEHRDCPTNRSTDACDVPADPLDDVAATEGTWPIPPTHPGTHALRRVVKNVWAWPSTEQEMTCPPLLWCPGPG